MDLVEAVVAGQVLDGSGVPIDGATVEITADCSSELNPGCRIGTSVSTDSEGRFSARIPEEYRSPHPAEITVTVTPGAGDGYVLGRAEVTGLEGAFQEPPAADTTFVQVVLPLNVVDSRRPVRVQSVGHRASARPLRVDEERVYLSNPSGVAALDQATGRCLWQKGASSGLAGLPYVLVDGVIAMARDVTLTAVRASDGETLWSHDGLPNHSLTASDPSGLYATDGSGVVAYDPSNGTVRWRRDLIGNGDVILAASGALVCAEILSFLECWEASTGEPAWSRAVDPGNWLAVTADRVLVDSQAGWTALDASTGETLWETSVESFPAPAVAEDGGLAIACSEAVCTAVDMENGRTAWSVPFESHTGKPVVEGDAVYVTFQTGTTSALLVLDAATGAIRERILSDPFDGGFSSGAPAVGPQLVFLFGGFGNLYAFERQP